jgi:Icc-related predicted phosphoesterase
MSDQRVTRILCAADPGGEEASAQRLTAALRETEADAVALVGDLGEAGEAQGYRTLFRALGEAGVPAFWVPGPGDAPVDGYLREAHNLEVVFPQLHGVHGTAALAPGGHVVFAGLGGEVGDEPGAVRDESERLHYPAWEAEYRLKVVRELDEHQLVLLLWSHPAHKGHGTPGSEVLAELVNTYRPRLVVCGGPRGTETLGRSLVVAPGSLREGHYAVADLQAHSAELGEMAGEKFLA